ncbi:MAG: SpoIIE family protein phosphatase [Chloroflexales bacterium]|nr:SpoIIE family protein phosphatase [Chloroflexales bacterium]
MAVSWGAVVRPKAGQTVSGDTYVVASFEPAGLLVCVIDGLGGGAEAAHAALAAAEVVRARPGDDQAMLLQRAHGALHGTRGAVMSLLTFNLQLRSVSYMGVGNIGAHVYSALPIKPISKNGIIGYKLPSLLKLSYSYNFGDTFVLYSDGVSSRLNLDTTIDTTLPPQRLAERILHLHGKDNDDATVVAVRITE